METINSKTCKSCGKTIRGRSDKKYCDDYCRNNFNNRLEAEDGIYLREVNNALSRNRRILQNIWSTYEKSQRVNREKLLYLGFQFRYCTQTFRSSKGFVYHFCYEYGLRQLDEEQYPVVKRKAET